MAVIEGVDHFLDIFRIVGKFGSEISSHCMHVQVFVLHEIQFAEDTFSKTSSSNCPVRCDVHQGLFVLIGQQEVGLLGTVLDYIVVSIGMLAAIMNVLLINALRVFAINFNSTSELQLHFNNQPSVKPKDSPKSD